jgi:hypothetical protein
MRVDLVKVELELTEEEWEDLIAAVASKARFVRDRHYGDFDPIDGFDPDDWARKLDELHNKLQDKLDSVV